MAMIVPCDVAQANQRAMVPIALPIPLSVYNISTARAFLAAFPWSEDAVFESHVWNPYVLIASFEWLTAAFALCNLWHLTEHIQIITLVWMIGGGTGVAIWFGVNSRHSTDGGTAMGITLAISYAATLWLCLNSITERNVDRTPTHHTPEHEKLLPDDQDVSPKTEPKTDDPEGQEQPLTVRTRIIVEEGRLW